MRRLAAAFPLACILMLGACSLESLTGISDPDAPRDLEYRLIPSGQPYEPAGILISWSPSRNGREVTYNVYGRSGRTGSWQLRATTTSYSFHDAGMPQLQYYVASANEQGDEVARSQEVMVDERNRLGAPGPLRSTSLDSAVHLAWSHYSGSAAQRFESFRIYSAPWSVSAARCVDTQWNFEGSTVSDAFLATGLANGASRCFAVSGVSLDGHESLWSPVRLDTPRPEARSVVLGVAQASPASSAFLFHDASAQRFGVVVDSGRADADFVAERHQDGSVWLRPVRAGTEVVAGTDPVADLRAVDRAPATGYARVAVQAKPGFAYSFRLGSAGSHRYGVIRVAHVGSELLLIDWAYQPAANNPELLVSTAP